jgi:hypothetical protein
MIKHKHIDTLSFDYFLKGEGVSSYVLLYDSLEYWFCFVLVLILEPEKGEQMKIKLIFF